MSRICRSSGRQCVGRWSPVLSTSVLGVLHTLWGGPGLLAATPARLLILQCSSQAWTWTMEWLLQILVSWDKPFSLSNFPPLAVPRAACCTCTHGLPPAPAQLVLWISTLACALTSPTPSALRPVQQTLQAQGEQICKAATALVGHRGLMPVPYI